MQQLQSSESCYAHWHCESVIESVVESFRLERRTTCHVQRRVRCCAGVAKQPPSISANDDAEDDDEDETCGFCKFMKAGGCRKAFTVSLKLTCMCRTVVQIL